MDSDGTCGYNLIDELFIIENYTFLQKLCVLSNFFTFYLKNEYDIIFPIYETLQTYISFEFVPCLVNNICT